MEGTTEDSDNAKLLKWWEVYAEQLESKLEQASKGRLESDSYVYSLLIVSFLAIAAAVAQDQGGADEGWATILIWVAAAPFLLGLLLIPVAVVQWVFKSLLRRRRDAEYRRQVDESRAWAYKSLGYSPPSAPVPGLDPRPGEDEAGA